MLNLKRPDKLRLLQQFHNELSEIGRFTVNVLLGFDVPDLESISEKHANKAFQIIAHALYQEGKGHVLESVEYQIWAIDHPFFSCVDRKRKIQK